MIAVLDVLSINEINRAYQIGHGRPDNGYWKQHGHLVGYQHPLGEHETCALSAVSEKLVAVALNRRWLSEGKSDPSGPEMPAQGDVEGGIEVRWTDKLNGHLIVRVRDLCPHYALVVGPAKHELFFIGGMREAKVKVPAFWRADKGNWWVPQAELTPVTLQATA